MITMITTTLILTGVATYYPRDYFAGKLLYCNYMDSRLVYTDTLEPWIALDVSYYLSGQVECGDEFVLTFEDGYTFTVRAWDAGYLSGHSVSTWPDLEIVVDIPEPLKPFDGISGLVTARRVREERRTSRGKRKRVR